MIKIHPRLINPPKATPALEPPDEFESSVEPSAKVAKTETVVSSQPTKLPVMGSSLNSSVTAESVSPFGFSKGFLTNSGSLSGVMANALFEMQFYT